jgi:hypothetical protein
LTAARSPDVTPHYIARAFFIGVPDPVPVRSMLIDGEVDAVAVPDLSPPARQAAPRRGALPHRPLGFKGARAEAYMLACLRAIADAPVGDRHPTIVRVAANLFGLAKGGLLDPEDVAGRIKGAVLLSSFDRGQDEVDSALRWAWEHSEARTLR